MQLPASLNALLGRFFTVKIPLAFLCGVIAHFGFAPYSLQWLTPLALMGLFALLNSLAIYSPRQSSAQLPSLTSKKLSFKCLSAKKQFQLGLSFGFGLFIAGLRWVHVSLDTYGGLPLPVTLLLMVLLALYLALFPALACYVFGQTKYKYPLFNVILFTSIWVLSEYLRGVVLTGFPWLSLGYSQTSGLFSQAASVIGVLGLTAIICLLATTTYYTVRYFDKLSTVLLVIVFSGSAFITSKGQLVTQEEFVNLALVQGNIKQSAKWNGKAMWPTITKYMDLTRKNFDSDVIIWPEAAMPAVESWVTDYLKVMDSSASFNDSAIITGIIGRTPKTPTDGPTTSASAPSPATHNYYNAIITVGNDKKDHNLEGIYSPNHTNRYYKHQLLPIGEFVPFEDLLRPLAPLFNLPMSSFQRGGWAQSNLVARGFKFAPALCYEIAFGELVRANMKPDTNFLLTVSNDAWFGESIGPHQHMQIAQMRAIELGRPLIRVTNTGVTAVVNTNGEIVSQLPQFQEAVLREKVHVVTGETFYYRYGQKPVLILFFSLFLITGVIGYFYQSALRKITIDI